MKILDVHVYKDGGSKLIETDNGRFFIPTVRMLSHKLKVFKGDTWPDEYSQEADASEVIELLDAMCHDSQMLHWIKRHVK